MTRFEFMTKLQGLLQDIPSEERNAAIGYYEDYFEDAGIENVDKIIAELGSPERVAGIIKSDLSDNLEKNYDKLEYTENGCHDRNVETDRFEILNSTQNQDTKGMEKEEQIPINNAYFGDESSQKSTYSSENTGQNHTYERDLKNNSYRKERRENSSSKTLLIILLCIFGIPVIVPIVAGIGSGILGIAAGLFSVFVAVGVSAIATLVAGIAVFVIGLVSVFQAPINSMFLCGTGLLSIGIGILFMILAATMWGKWLPALVKGVIYLCKLPFKKRREYV